MNYDDAKLLVEENRTKRDFLKAVESQSYSILKYLYKLCYMLKLDSCNKSVKNHWMGELRSPLSQLAFSYDKQASILEINTALIKNINNNFKLLKKDIFSNYGLKGGPRIFKDIDEIKYEDYYEIANIYIPKISKFFIDNFYNFRKEDSSKLVYDFVDKLF